jgi:hypothetical protein
MVSYSRRRTITGAFRFVCLDEQHLRTLAHIVRRFADQYGCPVSISIVPADASEEFNTEDPEFFLSLEMPRRIRSVSIKFSDYKSGASCAINLSSLTHSGAEVSVQGSDVTEVSGIFAELSACLKSTIVPGWRWHPTSMAADFLLGALLSVCVFFTMLPVARLMWRINPGWQSDLAKISTAVLLIVATIGALIFGGSVIVKLLQSTFPVVTFGGRLADPGTHHRARLLWLASAVFLPLLLNLLANWIVGRGS